MEKYGQTSVVGKPIIYWRLPTLPTCVQVTEKEIDMDPCHRNLTNFSDRECKKFFQTKFREEDVRVCPIDLTGDGERFDVTALGF